MPTTSRFSGGRVLAGWLLLILPGPTRLAAEDEQRDLTSLSLEELARTKVTSVSKSEEPRFETPAAIHVVTSEDIRRSGVTSAVEALRLSPGLHVARINSSQYAVGIRGFTNRNARSQLALMDGRSLYTPLFAGTYWEVQDTLLEDVERIEIVRGPGGTLWGANAVNGIINIITKDARDTQGGLVSAGAGNEERAFVRARYGGKAAEAGHYRIYAKYFDRDAGFHASGSDYDDWHMAQGGFRTDWRLRASDHLTVQGDAYSGRAGQRTDLSFYEPPYLRSVERDAELSGGNLAARWNRLLQGSQLTLSTYYDRTRRVQPNFREVRDTFDLELQHRFGLAESHEVVWGLAYRLSSGRTGGIETVVFVPSNRTDHIFSAFVQDRIALASDRVRLSLGAKLERNQYTGFELQPSARLLWAPSHRHAVWTAVTRAVRTPTRLERELSLTVAFNPSSPVFARVNGNEGFRSEHVVAYEAGYRIQPSGRASLSLALFHNRYGNLLSIEPGPPFREAGRLIQPFGFANLLRGRTSGLELSTLAHVASRWLVRAEYSYLNPDFETRPASTDTSSVTATEGGSPRHMARVQSSWSLPKGVEVDLSFRWVDELRAQKVPAYSTLDARIGWLVVERLELAVVGQSLLSAHHLEFGTPANRTEVERSIYGEARWRW